MDSLSFPEAGQLIPQALVLSLGVHSDSVQSTWCTKDGTWPETNLQARLASLQHRRTSIAGSPGALWHHISLSALSSMLFVSHRHKPNNFSHGSVWSWGLKEQPSHGNSSCKAAETIVWRWGDSRRRPLWVPADIRNLKSGTAKGCVSYKVCIEDVSRRCGNWIYCGYGVYELFQLQRQYCPVKDNKHVLL